VEDTTALSHIDEIAATPGIDVIFIGTSDLSFSLGLRGEQDHPRLDAAIAKIVAAGKNMEKPWPARAHDRKDQEISKAGLSFLHDCHGH